MTAWLLGRPVVVGSTREGDQGVDRVLPASGVESSRARFIDVDSEHAFLYAADGDLLHRVRFVVRDADGGNRSIESSVVSGWFKRFRTQIREFGK